MTAISLEALDAVPWDRLESALPQHPVEGVPRALRRLALGGGAATEEHCYPLSFCLTEGNGRVPSAATAAPPFLVALAADPGTLADGVVPLLERWRAETDPAMRLPVLLQLGWVAAEAAQGDARSVEEVRAVLDGVLRDGEPVMKVAAVIAWARLDPQEPVRRIDLLVETLSDLAVGPRFEEI
ncbi:hypothetical protein ABZW44_37450 [Streptomyces mirabilis]|uniref:hypothetical protein n=1 Tax=Streptomyces mirabilis TaxID=68239 RepID=UPI0033B7172F